MAIILVIEQDIILLNLISSALRQDGHTVIETTDPMHALTIAAEHAAALNLVLTDVEMEPISGFEIVKRLILNRIDIPAQFISGFPGITGVIASTYGAHAVIEKPFTASELRKGITRFLTKCRRRPNVSKDLQIEAA
jgi:two-component system cell cycle sensor histidine kinase/response regulator CckA